MYHRTITNQKNGSSKNRAHNQAGRSKWIKPFWIAFGSLAGLIVLIFILISLGWMGYMPSFAELENPSANLATEVISEDGELLGTYYRENRSNCKYSDLSKPLKDALIATEDSRKTANCWAPITWKTAPTANTTTCRNR